MINNVFCRTSLCTLSPWHHTCMTSKMCSICNRMHREANSHCDIWFTLVHCVRCRIWVRSWLFEKGKMRHHAIPKHVLGPIYALPRVHRVSLKAINSVPLHRACRNYKTLLRIAWNISLEAQRQHYKHCWKTFVNKKCLAALVCLQRWLTWLPY